MRRIVLAAGRLAQTRYPRFLFGLPLGPGQVPVFNYHDVEPQDFRDDLEFLERNGYGTLTLAQFERHRRAGSRQAAKAVLLTFDDARRSFWEVALPALREYRAHAALFVPTWWMNNSASPSPLRETFMSWDQLRDCVESGLVDVQSHAHRHTLVHTTDKVVDFANPDALKRYDIYDWPMRNGNQGEELGRPALGTPVYGATPLLSADRRYLESAELTEACREFVTRGGGARFFAHPGWRKLLRAFHASRSAHMAGEWMPAASFERLFTSELECSRDLIRARLGYTPTWLAFPWRLGARASLELAQRLGFHAAFGVALDFQAERARLPITVYGRFKCDWLRFLPGDGRASAFATIGRKIRGFSNVQHLAH